MTTKKSLKEILAEVLAVIGFCLFCLFGVKACVVAEHEWLLEQDRIRAEKREIWLERQRSENERF